MKPAHPPGPERLFEARKENRPHTKLTLPPSVRSCLPRKVLLRNIRSSGGERRRQNTWCRTGHQDFALKAATRPPNTGERAVDEKPLPTQPLPTCHSHRRIRPNSSQQRRGKGRFLRGTQSSLEGCPPKWQAHPAGRLQWESGYRLQQLERRTRTSWHREVKIQQPYVVEFLCWERPHHHQHTVLQPHLGSLRPYQSTHHAAPISWRLSLAST